MSSSHMHWLNALHLQCFSLVMSTWVLFNISKAQAQGPVARQKALKNSVNAIFVFGDSTADPGNNNYVTTIFKGNFLPYGRDFPNRVPTGRFTNGRLAYDFVASYAGIKEYVPPYSDPTLSIEELMTGVSFASAGSGFDPLTPQLSNVISLPKQLEYFKEYQKRVELVIGRKRTKNLVKNALYIVSAVTNDFVVNYFTVPIRRKRYSLPDYMEVSLQQVQQFMQGLLGQGARRIGVVGLPPMGCLPVVITLNSNNAILNRGCVDYFSSVARHHNLMLQSKLNTMQSNLFESAVRVIYIDVYGPLFDMIIQSLKFNFDKVSSGCCGTGLLEASYLCNPNSYVCYDPSKYVFWDSIHPSEKAYKLLFEATKSHIDFLITD
ncbi:GDSL esterase/lipase At5g45960-like [Rhododendron vialii]|uniref:GDSL esterase/lipase At5g45960-like n=1 Tax=Rhododendron vialii TaxID=182163 RepID=UPI0026601906|nr:GDSL esterase/lipase At5g45960-like [Rhododendron vialii]